MKFIIGLLSALVLLGNTTFSQTVTHGPIVGAVTSNSATFVVRTSSAATVQIQLSLSSSNFTSPLLTSSVLSAQSDTFFVKLTATGLAADTRYFYRVTLNGTPQSEIRSFKTFVADGATTPFAFAFGSCQQDGGALPSNVGAVFPLIAQNLRRNQSDPENRFMLQMGDWGYPDTTDTQQNPTNYFNLNYSLVQGAFLARYKPTYQMDSVFKVLPVAYTFSDHDHSNDNSDSTYPGRANTLRGYQTMFPHYPLVNSSTSSGGVWQKFKYGNAEFFVLDTRTTRDPNINGFPNAGAWIANPASQTNPTGVRLAFAPATTHKIVSDEQMNWLTQNLISSTATWKFIVSSEAFNPAQRGAVELGLLLQASRFDPVITPQGQFTAAQVAVDYSDGWCGFPESVTQLVRAVRNANVQNVIMLSGDSHNVGTDNGENSLFPEFMAGGLDQDNSRNIALLETFGINVWNRARQGLARNNFNSAFGRVSVFGNDSVRVDYFDAFGTFIDSYRQTPGHLVATKALTLAPQGQNFDTVTVGSVSSSALMLVNSGADTLTVLSVSRLTASRPSPFIVNPQSQPTTLTFPLLIPPGRSRLLPLVFVPSVQGLALDTVIIVSNDPDNPTGLGAGVNLAILQGRGRQTSGVANTLGQATEFQLEQNYPNPFNPQTTIGFALPKTEMVSLKVFDVLGREVQTLVQERKTAGRYEVKWDASRYSSGVYFYQLRAGNFVQTAKMLLVK